MGSGLQQAGCRDAGRAAPAAGAAVPRDRRDAGLRACAIQCTRGCKAPGKPIGAEVVVSAGGPLRRPSIIRTPLNSRVRWPVIQVGEYQHRKNAQDAKRGKIFTKLIREISVAARRGGDIA